MPDGSGLSSSELSALSDLLMCCGRMFPDFSLSDLSSPAFSPRWTTSGILVAGQVLTLSGLACHSGGSEYSACSLSDILEPDAPPKYSLSPRAARGILRRAERRGRELPQALRMALEALASRLA